MLMDNIPISLSLFITGCCPGGGASNFWTILLRGNLNLSVTMTFISSIAAFGAMPAWIFSLGRTIYDEGQVVIPYTMIAALIIGLVVPCAVGLGLQRCAPKAAAILSSKLLRPVALVFIVYLLTVGTYANFYIIRLVTFEASQFSKFPLLHSIPVLMT
jgi:sodium/bile acid cotransporter 3/5